MTEIEEKRVNELMTALDCSEAEAIDIIETDKIIDKGGRTQYDLSPEDEKAALKMSAVNERKAKNPDNKRGKVRAENPTKAGIINEIAEILTDSSNFSYENVKITNKERQIAFSIGENDFELTLVQKRKKKN